LSLLQPGGSALAVLRAAGGHRDSPNIWVSLEWGLSQQGGSAQCNRRTFAPRSVNRALMAGQRYRFWVLIESDGRSEISD